MPVHWHHSGQTVLRGLPKKGEYEVRIGASSKDIRLTSGFTLPETVVVENFMMFFIQTDLLTDLVSPEKK